MQHQQIDGGRPFDWGLASDDYAKYRDIYPELLYQTLYELGIGLPGQQVLDIGTGTGVLPRHMAHYGAQYTGLDLSREQLLQAQALTRAAGLSIAYVAGDANAPPFQADTFDCITAAQCWQYLNPERAVPAFHRILKPGGRLAIIYMAWLPDENPAVQRSIALVRRFNPAWDGHDSRFQYAAPPWCGESIRPVEHRALDVLLPFTREAWNGRMRACRGIGASLPPEEVEAFSRAHLQLLEQTMPERFFIRHELSIQLFQFL